ncbi:MAG: hypothetical protein J6A29_03305 [Clostridia bacterium]|nr:hypothetical protein [Clostridia bacterium]
MVKSVFKEIIIVLLLIVVIILLLGILFYDYMPNSKTIPSKVQEYALEETVQQELDKELNNINSEEIIKTYKLDAKDIEHYEKTNEYDKGKINPFAEDSVGTDNTSNNSNNSTTDNSSKDNFLNTVGK